MTRAIVLLSYLLFFDLTVQEWSIPNVRWSSFQDRTNDIVAATRELRNVEEKSFKSSSSVNHGYFGEFRSRDLLSVANNNTGSPNNDTEKKNASAASFGERLTSAEKIAFTVGYAIGMTVGLTGNILILIVTITNKDLHSNTNFLLCNMVIADILRTITAVPYELYVIHAKGTGTAYIPAISAGHSGKALCKVLWAVPNLFQDAFVFTLVSLTFQRFVAILFPFRAGIFKGKTKWFLLVIWFCAGVMSIPMFHATTTVEWKSKSYCGIDFRPFSGASPESQLEVYLNFLRFRVYVAFVTPFVTILALNLIIVAKIMRRKRSSLVTHSTQTDSTNRVVIMIATLSLIFVLTSLPNQVYYFLYIKDRMKLHRNLPVYFTFLLIFISEISSVVNPWLYPVFVKRFREKYAALLVKLGCPIQPYSAPHGDNGSGRSRTLSSNFNSSKIVNHIETKC